MQGTTLHQPSAGPPPTALDQLPSSELLTDLLCSLCYVTGTTSGQDLAAELQRLSSNQLAVAAEAETPDCDLCKQPSLFSYYEAVSTLAWRLHVVRTQALLIMLGLYMQ